MRAAILRQQGNDAEAEAPLTRALDELVAIRGGRIAATIWLRAQIFGDLAGIAEARGDRAAAEAPPSRGGGAARRRTIPIPPPCSAPRAGSPASCCAPAAPTRRWPCSARSSPPIGPGAAPLARPAAGRSAPYFALLAERAPTRPPRPSCSPPARSSPGPASPRPRRCSRASLSGGSDEAAAPVPPVAQPHPRVERERVELARLEAREGAGAATRAPRRCATSLAQLRQDQIATQARLAAFPRYRVVADGAHYARRSAGSCCGRARPITS